MKQWGVALFASEISGKTAMRSLAMLSAILIFRKKHMGRLNKAAEILFGIARSSGQLLLFVSMCKIREMQRNNLLCTIYTVFEICGLGKSLQASQLQIESHTQTTVSKVLNSAMNTLV